MKCPNVRCGRAIAVEATSCVCGWRSSSYVPFISNVPPAEPPKPYRPPSNETLENFKAAMKGFGHKKGPWWTPDRVVNAQQVAFIVIQANKFGPLSQQGRFLALCKQVGWVTDDNKLRMREPGEDEMEAA